MSLCQLAAYPPGKQAGRIKSNPDTAGGSSGMHPPMPSSLLGSTAREPPEPTSQSCGVPARLCVPRLV